MSLPTVLAFRLNPYDPDPLYKGENLDKQVVAPCWVTPESNTLDHCNFDVIKARLNAADAEYQIITVQHWQEGQVSIITCLKETAGEKILEEAAEQLSRYPILDEEALAQAEQ